MVIILLFTAGCSGKKSADNDSNSVNNESKPGRFIEYDISPPIDSEFLTFLIEGNNIVCFDRSLETRCDSTDGGATWRKTEGPGAGSDHLKNMESMTVAPDGSIFVYIKGEGVFKILPDGSEEKVPIKELDDVISNGENLMLTRLQALSTDRILLSWMAGGNFSVQRFVPGENEGIDEETSETVMGSGSGSEPNTGSNDAGTTDGSPATKNPGGRVSGSSPGGGSGNNKSNVGVGPGDFKSYLYTVDGSLVADFSSFSIGGAASDGSLFYITDSQSWQVLTYNLSDGKRTNAAARSMPSSSGDGPGGVAFFGPGGGETIAIDEKGAVYLMSGSDLLKVEIDGQSGILLPGANYSIGTPRMNVSSIIPLSDGSLVVGLHSMENSKLYKYVWDEKASEASEKTLNVWSLEDSGFVRAVISSFRSAHPEVTINYEVALTDEAGVTANDAIKSLNTRMLSGSAPDVIILDGCPAESYASKGFLLDLMPLIETGSIFNNILTAFENNGSLWYVPGALEFPVLLGQKDKLSDVNSLEALTNVVISGNGRPEGGRRPGPGGGLSSLPESERPALYFSELRDIFDPIWYSSAMEVVRNGSLNMAALEKMLRALEVVSDKYELCAERNDEGGHMTAMFSDGSGAMRVPESAIWYSSECANYSAFTVSSLILLALQSERPGSAFAAFPGLTADSFLPSVLAGISADTKAQDLAAEFIQTMFSFEVQSVGYGDSGLPVTNEGLEGQINTYNERLKERGGEESILGLDIVSVIQGLKEPVLTDEVLTNAIWTEAERLCKGEIGIEKALKNIEQNVKNYLAERA